MTFLNTILDSEEQAKKSISEAEMEAKSLLEETETNAAKELLEFEQSLKEKEQEACNEQKDNLKKIFTDIVSKEKVKADTITKSAESKEKEAVSLILKSLL